MNVQELITVLEKIEDKTLEVGTLDFEGAYGEHTMIKVISSLSIVDEEDHILYLDREQR